MFSDKKVEFRKLEGFRIWKTIKLKLPLQKVQKYRMNKLQV